MIGLIKITDDGCKSTFFDMLNIGSNNLVFTSPIDPLQLSNVAYRLTPPGIVNLFGERYILLRIDELEDHIYGSYSYGNNVPGIGLFKMASSLGSVTSLRFDFVNFTKKPFHPIGKLSKITIKFMTSGGDLYDFKGVDHHLIFSFKFLVPAPKNTTMTQSILNPQYNPDLVSYMANHKSIEYHEESEDEEDFTDYRLTYKKDFEEYDTSSNDDNSEEDSD